MIGSRGRTHVKPSSLDRWIALPHTGAMPREWLLLIASVTATLVLGLLLVRWLAPELLGVPAIPIDLRVVQVDDRVVPFYENVIRSDDFAVGSHLLNDPYTGVRFKQFLPDVGGLGPTDALGFRNLAVPNRAAIIAIGDSQTYGTRVAIEETWPSRLGRAAGVTSYTMAVGGWGAVQYLDMFLKSRVFRPRVAIVAFYTGNDPYESFRLAYSTEHWHFLRPDRSLSVEDLPPVKYPAPPEERWRVRFPDGFETGFQPALRLASQLDVPSVRAGWAIMADVARRIGRTAADYEVVPVFAIVPTKERVYAARIEAIGAPVDSVYAALVEAEARNVTRLLEVLNAEGAITVDLLPALARAALDRAPVYPEDADGHPTATGHAVIAATLLPVVREALASSPQRTRVAP